MRRNTVRDSATVTVSDAVQVKRKPRKVGPRNGMVQTEAVDPQVMDAARAALRPGERLVIVSPGVVVTAYA